MAKRCCARDGAAIPAAQAMTDSVGFHTSQNAGGAAIPAAQPMFDSNILHAKRCHRAHYRSCASGNGGDRRTDRKRSLGPDLRIWPTTHRSREAPMSSTQSGMRSHDTFRLTGSLWLSPHVWQEKGTKREWTRILQQSCMRRSSTRVMLLEAYSTVADRFT